MASINKQNRLSNIRANLKRGDIVQIAELAQVSPVWVSYVLHNKGTSEPVLLIAEELIQSREQDIKDNLKSI